MVHFFYNLEYTDAKEKKKPEPKESSNLVDVEMAEPNDAEEPDYPLYINALAYGIADKYGVLDMKAYALERTSTLLTPGIDDLQFEWLDFFRAADVVWATTPDGDKGLRKLYLVTALTHRSKILENEEAFRGQLQNTADFLLDLLMEDWKTDLSKDRSLNMVREFRCYGCSSKVSEVKCRRCRSAKMAACYVPGPT